MLSSSSVDRTRDSPNRKIILCRLYKDQIATCNSRSHWVETVWFASRFSCLILESSIQIQSLINLSISHTGDRSKMISYQHVNLITLNSSTGSNNVNNGYFVESASPCQQARMADTEPRWSFAKRSSVSPLTSFLLLNLLGLFLRLPNDLLKQWTYGVILEIPPLKNQTLQLTETI